MLIPEKLDACLAWFHDTCTEHLTVSPFPLKIIASTSFVTVVHERNVIKQITRTGLKFNGCSRHRAYQRPALSRFSRVPSRATSTRYLGTAINYTIVAFCAYHRVPPIYGATIVRYLLPFTFPFFFSPIFSRFTMKLFRTECFTLFFRSRICAVGRWILLDDNAIQLYEILYFVLDIIVPLFRNDLMKELWIFDLSILILSILI